MKNLHRLACLTALAALLVSCTAPARAQESSPVYLVMDYMKLTPGGPDYAQVEQEIWKPIHQERIRSGSMVGWFLYKPVYPGLYPAYDFVTVNVFDSAEDVMASYELGLDEMRQAYPDAADWQLEEMLSRTEASRELVGGEVWVLSESTAPHVSMLRPSRYAQVAYMKVAPLQAGAYNEMEADVWKRLHQERVDRGIMNGWSQYALFLPGGAAYPHNYSTLEYFDDLSFLENGYPPGIFEAALPGMDMPALNIQTEAIRSQEKREVWMLVDSTVPAE